MNRIPSWQGTLENRHGVRRSVSRRHVSRPASNIQIITHSKFPNSGFSQTAPGRLESVCPVLPGVEFQRGGDSWANVVLVLPGKTGSSWVTCLPRSIPGAQSQAFFLLQFFFRGQVASIAGGNTAPPETLCWRGHPPGVPFLPSPLIIAVPPPPSHTKSGPPLSPSNQTPLRSNPFKAQAYQRKGACVPSPSDAVSSLSRWGFR